MKEKVPPFCIQKSEGGWCFLFSILIILLAIFFALIEIEIEGDCGWAECLPTPNLTRSKRSLTLYHVFMCIFLFLVLNSLFFIKPKKFTWKNFLYSLSMLLLLFMLEDLFWFILNPHFGIRNISKAWWHFRIGSVPVIYVVLPLLAAFLAGISGYINVFWKNLVVMLGGVGVVVLLAPLYHRFYSYMHP